MDEKLPTPPPLTTEQLATNAEQQEALARRFKDSISAGNTKFARAAAVARETEAIIGQAKTLKKQKALLTEIQIRRYAKALADLGDYKTAHKFDDSKEYDKIWRAIWKDDADQCKCKPLAQMGQDGEVMTYPRQFIQQTVYSIKHKRDVSLYCCNECGQMNAH